VEPSAFCPLSKQPGNRITGQPANPRCRVNSPWQKSSGFNRLQSRLAASGCIDDILAIQPASPSLRGGARALGHFRSCDLRLLRSGAERFRYAGGQTMRKPARAPGQGEGGKQDGAGDTPGSRSRRVRPSTRLGDPGCHRSPTTSKHFGAQRPRPVADFVRASRSTGQQLDLHAGAPSTLRARRASAVSSGMSRERAVTR